MRIGCCWCVFLSECVCPKLLGVAAVEPHEVRYDAWQPLYPNLRPQPKPVALDPCYFNPINELELCGRNLSRNRGILIISHISKKKLHPYVSAEPPVRRIPDPTTEPHLKSLPRERLGSA